MSNSQPLISIVIPAYNAMPYLKEAIESVLSQDYPRIELIVLDDGSKDDTAALLREYAGQFYFESQSNLGQAKTLNKGWALSKGEIIGYLSADDVLKKDAVSAAVTEFLKDENVVLTYSDNILIDQKSRFIREVHNASDYDLYNLLLNGYCLSGVGCFFRKNSIEKIGGWDPSYRFVADLEHQIRLASLGKFKHINRPLGCYRVHSGAISHSVASFAQAEELKDLMLKVIKQSDDPRIGQLKNVILSRAYLVSGRTHWRSGRKMLFLNYLLRAIQLDVSALGKMATYKIILNALLNAKIHNFLKQLKDLKRKWTASISQ